MPPKQSYYVLNLINTCPADPGFIFLVFVSTVDLDQLASYEAIGSGSTLFSNPIDNA